MSATSPPPDTCAASAVAGSLAPPDVRHASSSRRKTWTRPGSSVRVAPQGLVQGADTGADVGRGAERRLARGQGQRLAGHALHEGAGEGGRGVEGQAAIVEGPAESALQARDELHPLEAAEADLALERGFRGDGALGPRAARLAGEGADDVQHEVEHRLGPGPGCCHSLA